MRREIFISGLFTLAAILLMFLISLRLIKVGEYKGYIINFVVPSADGISEGSGVFMSGIPVGKVEKISLFDGGKRALLLLKIKKGVNITRDAKFYLRLKGVLGDRYVAIEQGDEKEFLKDGDVAYEKGEGFGLSSVARNIDDVSFAIVSTAKDISSLSKSASDFISDLRETLYYIKQASQTTMKNIERGSYEVPEILDKLSILLDKLSGTVSSFQEVIDEIKSRKGNIGESLDRLKSISYSAEEVVKNANEISNELKRVVEERKLGELFLGDGVAKINSTIEKAEEIAHGAKVIEEKSRKILDLFSGEISIRGEVGYRPQDKRVVFSEGLFGSIGKGSFLEIGVISPPGERNITGNILLGIRKDFFSLKGGFIRSSPGGSLSLFLGDFSFTTEIIFGNLRVFGGFKSYGFSFFIGGEDLINKPFPFLGIGFHKIL